MTVLRLLRAGSYFSPKTFLWGSTWLIMWSRVLRTIWISPECHQTTHFWFCGATIEWPQNYRKSFSYARSKSWKSSIYHPMSSRGIPRHSVHECWRRLKPWLIYIAFNFDRFRDPPSPFIFFTKNIPKGFACETILMIIFNNSKKEKGTFSRLSHPLLGPFASNVL